MKTIVALATALFALALFARPAQAGEEKNPGKLVQMLEAKLNSFHEMGANYKTNKQFKEFVKYTCQKGSMFTGVFGVCRSGEGIVCSAKKEAFVACSLICGVLAEGMTESAGFAESKCVTKHASKWGFADHHAAVQWAKATAKTHAQSLGPVQKLCPLLKKVAGSLPPELKEFAEACN